MREELLKGSFERQCTRFTLYYLNNDWVYVFFVDEILGVDDGVELYEAVKDVGGGKPVRMLIDAGEEGTIDQYFRSYIVTEPPMSLVQKVAVVVNNTGQRLIGNFFVRVNKPSKPVKIFDHFEDAVEWLRK